MYSAENQRDWPTMPATTRKTASASVHGHCKKAGWLEFSGAFNTI